MGKRWQLLMIGATMLASASAADANTMVRPVGNPGDWVTTADYPASALQTYAEGTTGFVLDVGPDGSVTGCTITSSSGTGALDDATCTLLRMRARFTPATDSQGHAIASAYSSRVRWQIPNGGTSMSEAHFLDCLANDREIIQIETPFGCQH